MRILILMLFISSCVVNKSNMKEREFYRAYISVYNSENVQAMFNDSKDDHKQLIRSNISYLEGIKEVSFNEHIKYLEDIGIKSDAEKSELRTDVFNSKLELEQLLKKESLTDVEKKYVKRRLVSFYGFQDVTPIHFLTSGVIFSRGFVEEVTRDNQHMREIFFENTIYEEGLFEKYNIKEEDPVYFFALINNETTSKALSAFYDKKISSKYTVQKEKLKKLLSMALKPNCKLVRIAE